MAGMSCRGDEALGPPGLGGGSDGGGPGSTREVLEIDGAVGTPRLDAAPRRDAAAPADASADDDEDAPQEPPDASSAPDAPAARACDLLLQDCPVAQGCYPTGLGGAGCRQSDLGQNENGPCFQHSDCLPGLVCRGVLNDVLVCVALCDRTLPCGRNSCAPLDGYADVGFCPP